MERVHNITQHIFRKSRVDPNPEDIVHYEIGYRQIADNSLFDILVGRLAHKIAAEEKAGADFMFVEPFDNAVTVEWRIFFHRNRKTEPARLGIRSRFGKREILL